VREQEQSFNLVEVDEASVTITVNGWEGTRFTPLNAQQYGWEDGRWRIASAEETH
jgi:hypothetical protein